jgi:hypothetical protein
MMAENDEAVDQYWSFNPRLFSILDRLEVQQKSTGGSPAHQLFLKIWFRASEDETEDIRRLYLSFEIVSELKINPRGFIQIPVLEIVSIKEYQWGDLKYRVADIEENQLSFYCKQFEVNIVDKEGIDRNT